MIRQHCFHLFCRYKVVKVAREGLQFQKQSPVDIWFSQWQPDTRAFHLSIFLRREINWTDVAHKNKPTKPNFFTSLFSESYLARQPSFHLTPNKQSCCQTGVSQLKRQPGLGCFVPHRIKHVMSCWNIKAVKSNEATCLPFEPCLSDPPLFQIIMSQLGPALKCD